MNHEKQTDFEREKKKISETFIGRVHPKMKMS